MGINPKNRDDMFLAKAVGEDVDLTSITPPTAVSDREKLLVKLGERLDSIGGSAEIIVAPEQIVEITGNEEVGAEILLADGLSVEYDDNNGTYVIVGDNFEGNSDFSTCSASVNGIDLEWNDDALTATVGNVDYFIWLDNGGIYFGVENSDGGLPGDYTVKITAAPLEDGGNSSLPAVTAEDNGNVLTVVNGEWDKAEPREPSNVLIAKIDSNYGAPIIDKTSAEIRAAFQAKVPVFGVMDYVVYTARNLGTNIGFERIMFDLTTNKLSCTLIELAPDNTTELTNREYTLTTV